MKTPSRLFTLCSTLLLLAANVFGSESAGYLFVTYRGERQPQEEQIHFALSEDGLKWTALNGGAPVLTSTVGETGARDPFLLRSHDGSKFYLLATDLAIHRTRDFRRAMRAGSRSIVIWESSDLVNWSAPRLAKVAPDNAGCAWAPEAIYDPFQDAYLVYWASAVSTDGFAKHSIWASYTKDFVTFDPPFLFWDRFGPVGDATIVRANDAYYRFARDDRTSSIIMEIAPNLGGPWSQLLDTSVKGVASGAGPICFPLSGNGGWCLFISDPRRGYHPFVSNNLADGFFRRVEGVRFPFDFRQGSVLPVSAEESQRLRTAYKN